MASATAASVSITDLTSSLDLTLLVEKTGLRAVDAWQSVVKPFARETYLRAESLVMRYPETAIYLLIAFAVLVLYFLGERMIKTVFSFFTSRRFEEPVYLVDFVTFKPPQTLRVTKDLWMARNEEFKWSQEDLDFQMKLLDRSGLGDTTCFPPSIVHPPAKLNIQTAREEAEQVMFGCLDELFQRHKLKPKDVDILIVNCSLFNPTPSLSAMIINRYKLREDIFSFNLSGMGCSAGLISVDLARDLLQVHKNANAIIVSTENITQNIYLGAEKSMLVSNTLFRMGGAALYLTNRKSQRSRARWQLRHLVRTHMGAEDLSYKCVFQDLDSEGKLGVRLDKVLMSAATRALQRNITKMGPLILPYYEQIKYVIRFVLWKRALAAFNREHKKEQLETSLSTSSSSDSAVSTSTSSTGTNVSGKGGKDKDKDKDKDNDVTNRNGGNANGKNTQKGKKSSKDAVEGKESSSSNTNTNTNTDSTAATRSSRPTGPTPPPAPVPNFLTAVDHFCIHAGGRAVIDALEKALSLPEAKVRPSREALRRFGNTSSASIWYELEYIEKNDNPVRGEKVWQIAFGSGFKCNSGVWEKL